MTRTVPPQPGSADVPADEVAGVGAGEVLADEVADEVAGVGAGEVLTRSGELVLDDGAGAGELVVALGLGEVFLAEFLLTVTPDPMRYRAVAAVAVVVSKTLAVTSAPVQRSTWVRRGRISGSPSRSAIPPLGPGCYSPRSTTPKS